MFNTFKKADFVPHWAVFISLLLLSFAVAGLMYKGSISHTVIEQNVACNMTGTKIDDDRVYLKLNCNGRDDITYLNNKLMIDVLSSHTALLRCDLYADYSVGNCQIH